MVLCAPAAVMMKRARKDVLRVHAHLESVREFRQLLDNGAKIGTACAEQLRQSRMRKKNVLRVFDVCSQALRELLQTLAVSEANVCRETC